MELIIKNTIINAPIIDILKKARNLTSKNLFKDITGDENSDDVIVTCPFHKNGNETHPSCHVLNKRDTKIEYGKVHCFTCGHVSSLPNFIATSTESSIESIENWLILNFGSEVISEYALPEILIEKQPDVTIKYMKHEELEKYNYYHPYMFKRKLSKEVIDKFFVGFDKESNMITFPVWDEYNRLLGVTKRSVSSKFFSIPPSMDKPVYLLNYILNENIKTVYVCESQINALTLWSWSYPAVALFGTGSDYQYNILRKYSDLNFILCFDGDDAGSKGRDRFIHHLGASHMIATKAIPKGKDVNDLDKEKFEELELIS